MMFGTVKKLFAFPTTQEMELAYLNESVDRVDLEHRQREIDQGKFRRRRGNYPY